MHPKLNLAFAFSALTLIIAVGLLWLTPLRWLTNNPIIDKLEKCHLIIGVLSARNNSNQRQAIRETWFPRVSNTTFCIQAYFVVGEDSCRIPPEDRSDPYNCEMWDINLNDTGDAEKTHYSSAASLPEPTSSIRPIYAGLRFKVQHPIIVTKLGILQSLVESIHPISVVLQTTATQEEVTQVKLSSHNAGTLLNGYIYRPIEPLILPQGFEGSLILSRVNNLDPMQNEQCIYSNGGGLLSFTQVITGSGIVQPFDEHQVSAVSIGFKVHDFQMLKTHVVGQSTRQRNWDLIMAAENTSLFEELRNHDDIILVNVIDIYRNLPMKLLSLFEWVVATYDFDFLLKTDDDAVLNIENIAKPLKSIKSVKKFWWGSFRYNWLVQRFGKWQEINYGTIVYPPFPCGVANVLSSDLVCWIARNREELHKFQGEDVSIGIWLSAISPNYIHDDRWQCDDGCRKDSLSRGQLNPQEMKRAWNAFLHCQQLCDCQTDWN